MYGAGKRAQGIVQLRRRSDQRGFKIVGYIAASEKEEGRVADESKLVTLDDSLLAYCQANAIDEVVIAMDNRRRAFPIAELLDCRLAGIDILEVTSFLERETGKVKLDVLNPSWIIFSDGFRSSALTDALKRSVDILASLLLFVASSPIMLLAAAAIFLESGGPVLYRQTRVGLTGRHFQLLKFRSMVVDAERDGAPQWAAKNDARVTAVGAFIRKCRIDELPQAINVLRGDMSLVGPRPERPEFVEQLAESIPYYHERHCVKPGITGWAQLLYPYGSSEKDALEKLQYDLYYVKNRSVLIDLMILLQTVEVVFLGKGAR